MGLFKKKMKQEHKVMLQHERAAGALLPEYHRATPECPEPQLWSMIDSMTAEVEVLEFIATLVTTIKPRLVVETGSFLGVSTEWIARGLERNGFGKGGELRVRHGGLRKGEGPAGGFAVEAVDGAAERVQPGDAGGGDDRPAVFGFGHARFARPR
jgi:hypothetical protein